MRPEDAKLVDLLCEPGTHAPLHPVPGGLESKTGVFYPDVDGFRSLLPPRRTLRARFWEWVYNRTAFGYDFGVRFAWRLPLGGAPIVRDDYLSRLNFQPGMRLLETACGTGHNLLAVPGEVSCYGFDQSAAMLHRCRIKLAAERRKAGLVRADMHAVPFKSGRFDIVLHVGGLQFLTHPDTAIADWHRTAACGGQIMIVEESTSTRAILRRAGVKDIEALIPAGARQPDIRLISGGELLMISYLKA